LFKEIPDTIGMLVDLVKLDLSSNDNLSKLPSTLGFLRSLKFLSLRCCNLNSIPDGICRIMGMVELDISYNRIQLLPNDIGRLENLQSLNAKANYLQDLPMSIGCCSGLGIDGWKGLNIEENPIRDNKLQVLSHQSNSLLLSYLKERMYNNNAVPPYYKAQPMQRTGTHNDDQYK